MVLQGLRHQLPGKQQQVLRANAYAAQSCLFCFLIGSRNALLHEPSLKRAGVADLEVLRQMQEEGHTACASASTYRAADTCKLILVVHVPIHKCLHDVLKCKGEAASVQWPGAAHTS